MPESLNWERTLWTAGSAPSPLLRATNPPTTITTSTAGRRRRNVKLLADTSALLALVLADDNHHQAATRFARKSPRVRFVMTDLILSEVVTRLRARADAAQAVAFADDALRSRRYDVVFVDPEMLRGALDQ